MKKSIFLVLFALATVVNTSAQEVIAAGGYGYNQSDSIHKGDYGYVDLRVMFSLSEHFRLGLYGGWINYGNTIVKTSILQGTEWKYGISMDSYGPLSYSYSYYTWINSGLKNTTDNYRESNYKSTTLTNEIFLSGGLSISDDWQMWFGHNQIMFDYQKPLSAKTAATWKDVAVTGTPYNKESYRIVLESGIKRFGSVLNVEPIIHLGYGQDFGRNKNYYELGGGLSFGVNRDWYREILKVSVFQRSDINGTFNNINSLTPGNRLAIELTFNATSVYQLIFK